MIVQEICLVCERKSLRHLFMCGLSFGRCCKCNVSVVIPQKRISIWCNGRVTAICKKCANNKTGNFIKILKFSPISIELFTKLNDIVQNSYKYYPCKLKLSDSTMQDCVHALDLSTLTTMKTLQNLIIVFLTA